MCEIDLGLCLIFGGVFFGVVVEDCVFGFIGVG